MDGRHDVETRRRLAKKNLPLSLTARSWQPISGSQVENLTTISCGSWGKVSFHASSASPVSSPDSMSTSTQSTLEPHAGDASPAIEPSQIQFLQRTFADYLAEK